MSIGIICCQVLEKEIKALIRDREAVKHVKVMEWGLHVRPDLLLEAVCENIIAMQDQVDAIVLGYGRCQAMDRLPTDFKVPVFRPQAEDCIGVLLGQDRYDRELMNEAGTWFLTPGWTEMGMEFIFHELQLDKLCKKWANNPRMRDKDPLELAHMMLKDYTRALFIDMNLEDNGGLKKKAIEIAREFNFRLETVPGSLDLLEEALNLAKRTAT